MIKNFLFRGLRTDNFGKSRIIGGEGGFTLVEVIVAILIMGLAVQALLDLLHFGMAKYDSLLYGWHARIAISGVRNKVRAIIFNGLAETITSEKGIPLHLKSPDQRFILESLAVKSTPGGTFFVKAKFFEDRNRNKIPDIGEEILPPLWVFRTRTQK